jgi:hypothetical protein
VLKAAWWSESLGITQPVDWLTRKAQAGEKIPASNKEVYLDTSENFGYAVLSLVKAITFNASKIIVVTESRTQILSAGHELVIDSSITFDSARVIKNSDQTHCSLVRDGVELDADSLLISIFDVVDKQSQQTKRAVEVQLKHGLFEQNDTLIISNTMELDSCDRAEVTVNSPTRYTLFRIEVHASTEEVCSPSMLLHQWDAVRNGFSKHGEQAIKLKKREHKDFLVFEQSNLFPPQTSKHLYHWEFNHPNDTQE